MIDLEDCSESELAELIAQASKALDQKRAHHKRNVLGEMRKLAASIGVELTIHEASAGPQPPDRRAKVAVKYRDPANPDNAWSGRGVKPRWLVAYLDQGRSIEEFAV